MPTARQTFQAVVMGWPEIASTIAGVVLLPIVFYDLFQTVVLPRPAVRKFQLARYLVRPMWTVWRWVGLRSSSRVDRSEGRLAAFAPIALIVLILLWAFGLILGYGLILYGVRDQFRPELADFPEAFYVSASTLVPLAYGDFVPEQGFARFLIVLESHLAYPLLVYFRSSHDNEAWINSFGAVMDAAALVITSVEGDEAHGAAKLMFTVGNHLVEDIAWVFRFQSAADPIVEREEYVAAIARLKAAGYNAQDGDAHWQKFAKQRGRYAVPLNRMAQLLAAPPAPWVGDRSYLPHRQRPRRKKPATATPSS